MGLKLQADLAALEDGSGGGHGNGRIVTIGSLTSLQRDLLKDALAVVKRFKAMLRQRYHLDML